MWDLVGYGRPIQSSDEPSLTPTPETSAIRPSCDSKGGTRQVCQWTSGSRGASAPLWKERAELSLRCFRCWRGFPSLFEQNRLDHLLVVASRAKKPIYDQQEPDGNGRKPRGN